MTTGRWLYWSGLNYDQETMAFLRQVPGVIFWAEQMLLDARANLLITYEATADHPLTVPPDSWVHFDGRQFSWFEKGPEQ